MTIQDGLEVQSTSGYLGYGSNSTGVVRVDGIGSAWNNSGDLYVGGYTYGTGGGGTLSITGGGSVSNTNAYVACTPGVTSVVTVEGAGSNWTTSDYLLVGKRGGGTVFIVDGGSVICNYGAISAESMVTVSGVGSNWTNRLDLDVSNGGTLSIYNHGSVSSRRGYIGAYSGLKGAARVDGAGSIWDNIELDVGNYGGTGTLSITGGGTVTAATVFVYNATSLLAINVGRGSLLTIASGTGTINSIGKIRILASASVPADNTAYSPIAAQTFSGTGTFQAIGGTWNTTAHTFTASSVVTGSASTAVPLNLASAQRALVSDNGPGGTGWVVGVSFPAAGSTTNITFTASPMSSATLGTLGSKLAANESALSGWTFLTSGYTVSATNPIYLSLDVGPGYSSDDFNIWHYDGSTWTNYAPFDLTYDGTYASFTANGLSGYAVSAVPEPGTMGLLAAALLGFLACGWRKRKRE